MRPGHLAAVIVGMFMILSSFVISGSQAYQNECTMMHPSVYSSFYSYLPSILSVAGITLVVTPFVICFKDKSKKRAGITSETHVSRKYRKTPETLAVAEKLLEEDEKKVLKIIAENEGVTQDSLHFRTGFSTSKVSMIVKKLEEKDLIYRERFGKTYRLYLSDWVRD
ncbi:DUF7343 domain-containing protein [Geoglobus acetivorans]|uniref:MarR family transcriptional regulator n=1 Tax=Geoglobus acetivorans TaxID=565033 RepID=A0ABZ3H5L0_GEOAI|nr:MarR family transcriptional regulator [Geoglobus acetivorans]